jgi:hypothetical protein
MRTRRSPPNLLGVQREFSASEEMGKPTTHSAENLICDHAAGIAEPSDVNDAFLSWANIAKNLQ